MFGKMMRIKCVQSASHTVEVHLYNVRATTLLSYWEPYVTCVIDMIRLTDDYMTTPIYQSICIICFMHWLVTMYVLELAVEVCAVTEI